MNKIIVDFDEINGTSELFVDIKASNDSYSVEGYTANRIKYLNAQKL